MGEGNGVLVADTVGVVVCGGEVSEVDGVTSLDKLGVFLSEGVGNGTQIFLLLAALIPLEVNGFFGDEKRLPRLREGGCDVSPLGK